MKYSKNIVLLSLLILLSAPVMAQSRETVFLNLDFEKATLKNKPKIWFAGGKGYEARLDEKDFIHGKKSFLLEAINEKDRDFGMFSTELLPNVFLGKKITFTGYIKTSDVKEGYAGLWLRVDGKEKGKFLAFDNMSDRGVTGTTGWKKYTIEIPPISQNATYIVLGGLFTGKGKAWFDHFEILVDGKSYGDDETMYKAPEKNEIEWLKNNIIPIKTVKAGNGFEDLKPINEIIGDARIVSLGEATHGSKEIFQMKHRMLEYLVTEKGFNIFAIEAAMPEAYKLNDYIIYGKGDPKKLLAGMFFWTWNTEEVLDMILWMRKFNESGKGKIQFTGFDMQSIDGAMENLRNFAKKNDKSLLPALDKIADTFQQREEYIKKTNDYQTPEYLMKDYLTNSDRIYKHISENKDKYLKVLTTYEYEWLKQNANIILQKSVGATINDYNSNLRDKYMADNIKWILDNNPQSKIVIWAHNGHVNKQKDFMGWFLKEMYGNSQKVFGFAIGQGTYTAKDNEKGLNSYNILEVPEAGSFEYYFQSTESQIFILDLKKAKEEEPSSKWLLQDKLFRSIGSRSTDEQFYQTNISNLYDSIIYINKTNASVLNKKINK